MTATDIRRTSCPVAANPSMHRVVIVGGGVGGFALATRLADSIGKKQRAHVTLVDRAAAHFWKPRLHEVAAGQVDPATHQIQYAAHAQRHGFAFEQGELVALDRHARVVTIGATRDADGDELLPARELGYDTLVLAMGSVTNFFGVRGAADHALPLESVDQAEHFRRKLLAACTRANHARRAGSGATLEPVTINIIGAGATGVELAAALRGAAHQLNHYSLSSLDPVRDFRVRLIEGASRVLPALADQVSAGAAKRLAELDIDVLTDTRVTEVRDDAVLTHDGHALTGDIAIWTAGVSGPDVLRSLDGIAVTRNAQVLVRDTLQTTTDDAIFALGDCAACPAASASASASASNPAANPPSAPATTSFLAPRAQVAHQQAAFLARSIALRVVGDANPKPLPTFTFHDAGTLVGFGSEGTVGSLSSGVLANPVFVEGMLATLAYRLIYRRHVMTLNGFARMTFDAASHWLRRRANPVIRLY